MAPIAATFAMSWPPEAFLMATAARRTFTPIGHQCNTLVMGLGAIVRVIMRGLAHRLGVGAGGGHAADPKGMAGGIDGSRTYGTDGTGSNGPAGPEVIEWHDVALVSAGTGRRHAQYRGGSLHRRLSSLGPVSVPLPSGLGV